MLLHLPRLVVLPHSARSVVSGPSRRVLPGRRAVVRIQLLSETFLPIPPLGARVAKRQCRVAECCLDV